MHRFDTNKQVGAKLVPNNRERNKWCYFRPFKHNRFIHSVPSAMLRNVFYLAFALLFFSPAGVSAQHFRVQVAAFADSVSLTYFKDRGVNGVISSVDQNGIHRYFFGSYPTREAAERIQSQLVAKGFPSAAIIDLEEQQVLSNRSACPYFLGGPEYDASDDSVRIFLFDAGKSVLTEKAKADLDWAFKFLKSNPRLELRILGYTDASGTVKANVDLATTRARVARNYLLDKGAPADRILLRVFGESAAVHIEGDIESQIELEEARKRFRCVLIALVERG